MIDQESQAPFIGSYNQFNITLRMQGGSLLIQLENTDTFERHHQCINYAYVQNQKEFHNLIEDPFQIFEYLRANFADLIATNDSIVFDYKYGNGLKKKVKNISMKLISQEKDPLELANAKVNRIKQHFTRILREKDQQMRTLKEQLLKWKGQAVIKKKEEKPQLSPAHWISNHPENPHRMYFTVSQLTESRVTLTKNKKGQNRWDNFINKLALSESQNSSYFVKFNKITNNKIFIGFCTTACFGIDSNCWLNKQAAYYQFISGYLCSNGATNHIKITCSDKDQIQCSLMNSKIIWNKNGSKIAECRLPEEMRNKQLHFSILLHQNQDQVEVWRN